MATIDINLNNVQELLVSGTNIKTINGASLLGSGDISISSNNIGNSDLTISSSGTRKLILGGALSTDEFVIRDSTDSFDILTVNGVGQVWSHGVGNVASSTSFGYLSMTNNTAEHNTAFGTNTLASVTSGAFNTAIGTGALSANVTGANNVAVGRWAATNTTTSNVVALGMEALKDNTSGAGNVGVGYLSLENNTTGDLNTVLGDRASQFQVGTTTPLTVIERSVLIGARTKATQSSTNEIVIGYAAEGNGSNTATVGNSSTTDLYLGTTLHLYQETTGVTAETFTANTSGISDDTATWGGYTIGQIVGAMKAFGLLA